MKTEFTILCDNLVLSAMEVIGEHGLSVYISRQGGENILLDTGQGMGLARNARALNRRLDALSKVVLSHGHYDHTSGLPQVLRAGKRGMEIVAHPGIFVDRYREFSGPKGKFYIHIGLRYAIEYLESGLGARFNLMREFCEIAPGVFISGEVPRQTDFETGDPLLVVREGADYTPDPFPDDLSLLVETERGPVVVLGCAHAGTVNILRHFAERTGHKRFHAVIGGTHLGFSTPEQVKGTIDCLKDLGVEKLAVSHCTGMKGAMELAKAFGSAFEFAGVGWELII